jgi:hypothetical protein
MQDDFDMALDAADIEAREVAPTEDKPEGNDDLMRELAMEQLTDLRESLTEKYPSIAPFADMLSGDSPQAIEQLAYDLNQRLGGEVVENHPAANTEERRIAALPGQDVLAKSLADAKATGNISGFMALRRAHAYEQAGLSGSRLDAEQREDINAALRFAKASGDQAAVLRLRAQLG